MHSRETTGSVPTAIAPMDYARLAFDGIFQELDEAVKGVITEEDAKIKIINKVIMDVLGWGVDEVSAERQHVTGFSDYLIGKPTEPLFVVEAKRQGILTVDLARRDKMRHLTLTNTALKQCKEGVAQAHSYAAEEGLPFAVLTDGEVWIVFKTFIANKPYRSVPSFIFPSLTAVKNDFHIFYELLSAKSCEQRLYALRFDEIHNEAANVEAARYFPLSDSDVHLTAKTDFSFEIDRILGTFFDKLRGDSDPDLLLNCFVESRESRYADFSLEKLTDRILGNIKTGDIEGKLSNIIEIAANDASSGETVFIVGPNGAGKSTFVERFFKKILRQDLRVRCLSIHVDLLDITGSAASCSREAIEILIDIVHSQIYSETGGPNYDQIRGLYFSEYERRRKVTQRTLYNTNKNDFQIKFDEYIENIVENNREDYIKRLLKDIVNNRKILPVIVFDNIDDHDEQTKILIFQLAQSLRRHVTHCLLIFPITDKTAWAISKLDIINVYSSRSFFLPTPSPREIFRKRIDYLIGDDKNEMKRRTKEFYLSKGIRLQIEDIRKFSYIINDIFVRQEYTAQTLGEFSNYNIRVTLNLARRVITSAALGIVALVSAYVVGEATAISFDQFLEALVKGDYTAFKPEDCKQLCSIFETDQRLNQSPLLKLRILKLLEARLLQGRTVEERHIPVQAVVDFFDALGSSEASTSAALKTLLDAGLIETFDSSRGQLALDQSIAISHRGGAHLSLLSRYPVFVEQLALSTGVSERALADELRAFFLSTEVKKGRIAERFLAYALSRDTQLLGSVGDDDRGDQNALLQALRMLSFGKRPVTSGVAGVNSQHIKCIVEWFDKTLGYGFVKLVDKGVSALLHKNALNGISPELFEGDILVCELVEAEKGLSVERVISFEKERTQTADGIIRKLSVERAFAFVEIDGLPIDAYLPLGKLREDLQSSLKEGLRVSVSYAKNKSREGYVVTELTIV